MAGDKVDEVSIGVTAFKARCLALIEEVAQGKTRRVLLTKRNRPIAAIVPVEHGLQAHRCLRNDIRHTADHPTTRYDPHQPRNFRGTGSSGNSRHFSASCF